MAEQRIAVFVQPELKQFFKERGKEQGRNLARQIEHELKGVRDRIVEEQDHENPGI